MKIKERRDYLEPQKRKPFYIPKILKQKYEIEEALIQGSRVITLKPIKKHSKRHLFYLHGGAYAMGIHLLHFKLMDDLATRLDASISMVDYPLAPEHHVHEALSVCHEAYEKVCIDPHFEEIIVVGDSAGGGLALALAMDLRDKGRRRPDKLVLFSPWLDIGLMHQGIKDYDDKDYILNVKALRSIGEVYAHDLPLTDPRVSPIYGDLNHLGKIAIFYGTDEIFFPDCEGFGRRYPLIGTEITHYPYIGMQHDWLISPIIERELALMETQRFIFKGRFDTL